MIYNRLNTLIKDTHHVFLDISMPNVFTERPSRGGQNTGAAEVL